MRLPAGLAIKSFEYLRGFLWTDLPMPMSVPGGSAEAGGQIKVGDVLMQVEGVNVRPSQKSSGLDAFTSAMSLHVAFTSALTCGEERMRL